MKGTQPDLLTCDLLLHCSNRLVNQSDLFEKIQNIA